MPNFNKVIIAGHLTRDPEVKYTQGGTAICSLSLAVSEKWTDKQSGEKKESVAFIDCDAWGKSAEIIGQYCQKGKPLLIEGKIVQDTWEDKQTGQKRSKLKVKVENFQLLGSGQQGAPAPQDVHEPVPAGDESPF